MNGDELELEPAGEEADDEEDVGAIRQRLAKSLPERLLCWRVSQTDRWRRVDDERERQHHEHQRREGQKRALPADRADEPDRERRVEKLAERASRSAYS